MTGAPAPDARAELCGRIFILANPAAGLGDGKALARFVAALEGPGRDIAVVRSLGPGDLHRLAREVVADYVFVAGGDGSINEVAGGLLARNDPRPVLGIVPQGTVNVLAAELGLPRDPRLLAKAYLASSVVNLRLGLVNERPFLLMASAGLDAEVVQALRPRLKRILGRAAYLLEVVRLIRRDSPLLDIDTDAGAFRAKLAVLSKSSRYGGDLILAKDMSVLQPGLKLITLRDVGFLSLCRFAYFLFRGEPERSGLVEMVDVRHASVRAASPVATQADGDALGRTPIVVREAHEPLSILLPQQGPSV